MIIKGWAEILPILNSVEVLWVAPKVNQYLFDAICRMPKLRGLWVKHSSIKYVDSSPLQGLEFLRLGSSPSLNSIQQLANIESLKWLETENLKRITDFSLLSDLKQLVGLGIDGSMWTTQLVESLNPIAKLKKLRYPSLTNTRVIYKNLRPLHRLDNLKTIRMAQWWPKAEVAGLKHANPNLQGI